MSDGKQEVQKPAVEAPKSEIAKQLAALDPGDTSDLGTFEATIDVPVSDFWSNADAINGTKAKKAETPTAKAEEPATYDNIPDDQIITYKANGKEVKLSMAEVRKKLSMKDGEEKAFDKLSQATKKLKDYETKIPELQKKAELLDKLEEVKHDWRAILQIATGQDPDQFLQNVMREQNIMTKGSESEKAALRRERELKELELKLQAQADKQAALERKEQERLLSSEKDSLKNMLEAEFFKHKINLGNEIDSNDANELLWQQSQSRMRQYVKKYKDHPQFKELLPKMAQKSFEDVAGRLKRLTTGSVQAEVDKMITQKKQNAAEKAAVASGRNMTSPGFEEFKGMGVREIADKLLGKKKFSY